ncbi:MAG: hypothetical protein ACFB5Z_14995 [Elainellaceae cyanobacterium]
MSPSSPCRLKGQRVLKKAQVPKCFPKGDPFGDDGNPFEDDQGEDKNNPGQDG